MRSTVLWIAWVANCLIAIPCAAGEPWEQIERFFSPPEKLRNELGAYRSPLTFAGGAPVRSVRDWQLRRTEILTQWHDLLGHWPELLTNPVIEVLDTVRRENFEQRRVRFRWTPNEMTTGYLLIPDGEGPRPAVLTVYYEPETAIGMGKPNRDFGLQLARRGMVVLSIGTTEATAAKTYALYYPNIDHAEIQPLSMLAYAAANAWHVLASLPEVDPRRIGIVGHSFGGKWAMFASCLFDKFACAAWSDPGIVFDESRPNVNYWEPWYLGYHPPPWRRRDVITPGNPARGLYPRLVATGHDLHELHALMAPRPLLVSGGAEDPVKRWAALNHSIGVNRLLGYENRVAMTNRPTHDPTVESNEVIYKFFEHFLGSRSVAEESSASQGTVNAALIKELKGAKLSMQFHGQTTDDCRAWQNKFRAKLNELLGDTRPPKQWKVTEEARTELDDHVRYELLLESDEVPAVPVYLLVPLGLEKGVQVPGVICVHGHGPFGHHPVVGRRDLEGVAESIRHSNYDFGLQFVRRGYVVVAPCLIPFGRRVDRNLYSSDPCAVTLVRMLAVGKLPIAENVRDLRWAIDFLQSRPEVIGNRIGCAGLSYGGRMTMLVSALDDRIRVAAVSGALNLLQERLSAPYSCGSQIIPGLLNYGDFSEVGSLIAPRPCVWETGSSDHLILPRWGDIFRRRLRRAYQAFDAEQELHFDHFEGAHAWSGKIAFPVFDQALMP